MRKTIFLYILPIAAMLLPVSCSSGGSAASMHSDGKVIPVEYAENLAMTDYGDFLKVDFRNPWDTTRTLQTFLLVERDRELPADLPEGTVVRTPIERSVVYTSVHAALFDELGAGSSITGMCDTRYVMRPSLRSRLASGDIADCGSTMAPNIEKIAMLNPEAILLSAFENSNDHNKVGQTGITVIDCIDYMETSPLGRAEWMRFFGRLVGRGERADSLFAETVKAYNEVKATASAATSRPMVLTELIYGQTWDVPGALSTAGVMIEDAGGRNPFDSYRRSGSVKLTPEEVLFRAKDADIWLVKYDRKVPLTLSALASESPVYSKFRAHAEGRVYGLDTNTSSYFEDAAFHPHWVLAEYVNLFHPELESKTHLNRHYYKKLER